MLLKSTCSFIRSLQNQISALSQTHHHRTLLQYNVSLHPVSRGHHGVCEAPIYMKRDQCNETNRGDRYKKKKKIKPQSNQTLSLEYFM